MPTIKLINNLPNKVSYDEIMAEIYFKQRVDKSLKQIEEGRVISHKDAKRRILKYASI